MKIDELTIKIWILIWPQFRPKSKDLDDFWQILGSISSDSVVQSSRNLGSNFSLKGHWQGGTNPPFLFAKSKVPFYMNQTNKKASKNINIWRSYAHLKMRIFDGQKNALYEQIWFVTSLRVPFLKNHQRGWNGTAGRNGMILTS